MPQRPFDRVAVSMYLQEALELIDSLLFRLHLLEEAAARWLAAEEVAATQVLAHPDEADAEAFNRALHASGREQATMFDEVEAFLAAWARLSLLFWPIPRRGAPTYEFTKNRGTILVELFDLGAVCPLEDRELRDAWMHTDERFDAAWLDSRLGNRQQFVRTAGVSTAVEHAVRVLDVEALTLHARDNNGALIFLELRPLKPFLEDLLTRRKKALRDCLRMLPRTIGEGVQ
ncbi:MAG: hypothetical protein ACYC3F_01025 [Gemmatimonadaceae bacterium]